MNEFSIKNYPIFVMAHGNWDIMRNYSGTCVAIPNAQGESVGASSSFFGDYRWVKETFSL